MAKPAIKGGWHNLQTLSDSTAVPREQRTGIIIKEELWISYVSVQSCLFLCRYLIVLYIKADKPEYFRPFLATNL